MHRLLLEGSIVVLLVLIGISVFVPSREEITQDVIVNFEDTVTNGEVVEDGEMDDVEISEAGEINLISRINSKVANTLVNGLNNMFEIGMKLLRKAIN